MFPFQIMTHLNPTHPTKIMTTLATLKDFLDANQNDFDKLFTDLKVGQVQELAKEADQMAQKASIVAAYLEARGANGCGDNGHKSGIHEGGRQLKAVRRAMGYTSP